MPMHSSLACRENGVNIKPTHWKPHGVDQAYVVPGQPLNPSPGGMDILVNVMSCQSISGEVSPISDIFDCCGVCHPDTPASNCPHDAKCNCEEEGKEAECFHQHACEHGMAVIKLPMFVTQQQGYIVLKHDQVPCAACVV